jgi:hypothetical protein
MGYPMTEVTLDGGALDGFLALAVGAIYLLSNPEITSAALF